MPISIKNIAYILQKILENQTSSAPKIKYIMTKLGLFQECKFGFAFEN